ncbi:hypothetical protein LIER_24502 [Lithospermum erythrorhizon]|uniref:Uncharacterized protein n=1 Tax=Lithospermum erythrorhizon TaxID=34254 RepID=A0AAV3R2U5_LITER
MLGPASEPSMQSSRSNVQDRIGLPDKTSITQPDAHTKGQKRDVMVTLSDDIAGGADMSTTWQTTWLLTCRAG